MTSGRLHEYRECCEYVNELDRKRQKMEYEISAMRSDIERGGWGGTVTEVVTGGAGGRQRFSVAGKPEGADGGKRTRLMLKLLAYEDVCRLLESQRDDLAGRMAEAEQFISEIDDIHMRRIVNLRFIEGMKWGDVARAMGGGNSEDGVKKAFYRYMESAGQPGGDSGQ